MWTWICIQRIHRYNISGQILSSYNIENISSKNIERWLKTFDFRYLIFRIHQVTHLLPSARIRMRLNILRTVARFLCALCVARVDCVILRFVWFYVNVHMHDTYRRMYETEWWRYSATPNCHQARVTRNCQIFLSKLLSSVVKLCKFGTEVTLYLGRQQHGSETKTGFTRRYVYRMRHSKYTMYTNGSFNRMDYKEIQYRDTDFVYPENVGLWRYFLYKVSRSKNDRRRWSISTNETVYFILGMWNRQRRSSRNEHYGLRCDSATFLLLNSSN